MADEPPDIVYVVRPGERNPALRYSLRSLANLPHRRVFVAGYCPTWVSNVTPIPVPRKTNKFVSIEANLRGALHHPDIGEQCVYFNDDFFVTQPIDEVPVMHGGPIEEYRPRDEMRWRLARTVKEFTNWREPLRTYDGVHVPMPLNTSEACWNLNRIPGGCLWRTWYGNKVCLGGEQIRDVKVRSGGPKEGPFLSCSPKGLHGIREYLEDVLPRSYAYTS